MSNHETFPQQWGEHLKPNATVTAQQYVPPKGSNTLLFEDMHSETFEQLCWWLLQKDYTLSGCQRLGHKGKVSQHGIDIFAFDRLRRDRLLVFECKCWRNFSGAELTKAVDHFLANEWAESAGHFTLILAQRSIKSLDRHWIAAHKKLLARGIEGELWTAEQLTEKLQTAPDVLTRFFSGPDIQHYCNRWMQKVGFHEALLKAMTDPRRDVAALAHDFLTKGAVNTEDLTSRYINDRHWSLRQPWIEVSALLPSIEQYPGSAIVSIKMPDTEGVMVVLDQQWLLSHLLGNQGEPLLAKVRPFFKGVAGQQRNNQIIDLKNCRFFLPEKAAQEVASVADEFSLAYLQALRQLETQWEAQNFPFVNWLGTRVVVCVVDAWVWHSVIEFANAHDTRNGTSEWHKFHNAPNRLMPVSAAGYHGVFFGATIAGLCHEDQVAILWEPLTAHHRPFSEQGWSCTKTYQWLVDELLPTVGNWRARRISQRWRNWLHPFATREEVARVTRFWSSEDAYTDVRSLPLWENQHFREVGIMHTLQILQGFYHSGRSQRAWFTPAQRAGLYQAMLLLLEGRHGHVGYMRSNLSISTPCENHDDLNEAVRDIIEQLHLSQDGDAIDYVLSAMLEAVGGDDSWITGHAREQIYQALVPYMGFYDQQLLIDRHSLYL